MFFFETIADPLFSIEKVTVTPSYRLSRSLVENSMASSHSLRETARSRSKLRYLHLENLFFWEFKYCSQIVTDLQLLASKFCPYLYMIEDLDCYRSRLPRENMDFLIEEYNMLGVWLDRNLAGRALLDADAAVPPGLWTLVFAKAFTTPVSHRKQPPHDGIYYVLQQLVGREGSMFLPPKKNLKRARLLDE
jgi:hypothetical protein